MFLFPLMKKRSAANPLAALRGLVWATDFTEGADAQVLYNTIDGDTVGTGTGTRGTTSGSEAEDPTWGSAGADFTANQRFIDVGSDGQFDFLGKPNSGAWSFHCRCKPTWDGSSNGHILFENGADVRFWWAGNFGQFSFWFTCNGVDKTIFSLGTTTDFKTISVVVDGAGNISFYVNGAFNSTTTVGGDNPTSTAKANINYSPVFGGSSWISTRACTNRAILIANVEHDATEVSDIHDLMAALPNAA